MYTLYGLLARDEELSPVNIDETQSVGDLQEKIKKENTATLVNVDPKDLKIYHINLNYDKTKYFKQANDIFKHPSKYKLLEPFDDLRQVFQGSPAHLIHTLVAFPPGEAKDSRACDVRR
jgi:hypothetical protein